MTDPIAPTPYQSRVLHVPETYDLALAGGRGGGKSYCAALLILRHCEAHQERARVLVVRRTHRSLEDFALILRSIFGGYGRDAHYNAQAGTWRLPGGAYCELGQLTDASDYARYQGRSFSLIVVDEASQHASPELLDLLRSNLRAPKPTPTRFVLIANPGSVGQNWIAKRYVLARTPWAPFVEESSGRTFVTCPSLFTDNPHVDHREYSAQLSAACASDPALLAAWAEGNWLVARGAYFSDVLGPSVSFGPWDPQDFAAIRDEPRAQRVRYRWESEDRWRLYLSHDYGSAAPSVTYVCAVSPGAQGPCGRWFPRDSILLLDELATCEPGSTTRGLGWTTDRLAAAIRDLATPWGCPPSGVADDAIFSQHGSSSGSIADELSRCGVHFSAAGKGSRVSGWQLTRSLLANAGKVDTPALYVSRACQYWWETIPVLPRDPRRPEDLDSRAPDHAADATRYGVLNSGPTVHVRPLHELLR
jgi:hypothetical protein